REIWKIRHEAGFRSEVAACACVQVERVARQVHGREDESRLHPEEGVRRCSLGGEKVRRGKGRRAQACGAKGRRQESRRRAERREQGRSEKGRRGQKSRREPEGCRLPRAEGQDDEAP